jgi:hypothetical protein
VSLRQEDGSEVWSINCDNINEEPGTACADRIEAESSLSPNGLVLYYGDLSGNVKALQLGESTVETPAPTEYPTRFVPTPEPSSVPSDSPIVSPSQTPSVSLSPTDPPSIYFPLQPTRLPSFSPTPLKKRAPFSSTLSPDQETPNPEDSGCSRPAIASVVGVLAALVFFV